MYFSKVDVHYLVYMLLAVAQLSDTYRQKESTKQVRAIMVNITDRMNEYKKQENTPFYVFIVLAIIDPWNI